MLLRTALFRLSRILTRVEFCNHASFRSASTQLQDYRALVTEVNNVPIHYLKVGNGPHNILLLPGSLGTATNTFMPQLTGLDRELFTIYAWDPPGCGKSRPPNKIWESDFFYRDAEDAAGFLKALDIRESSLFGYSYGGVTAFILTILYPSLVNRLVVSGAKAYMTKKDLEPHEAYHNMDVWSPSFKERFESVYGEDLQELWNDSIDAMASLVTGDYEGNMIADRIHEINNPTLLFYGGKDSFVSPEHPRFLLSQIRGAQLINWPNAKHDLHMTYSKDFNMLITDFLTK